MSLIRTLKECIAQLIVSLYNAQLNFPQPKPLPAACYGSVPMICDENVTTNSLPSFYYKLEPRIKLPLKVKAEAGVAAGLKAGRWGSGGGQDALGTTGADQFQKSCLPKKTQGPVSVISATPISCWGIFPETNNLSIFLVTCYSTGWAL